jgi:hypothetical protein
MDKATSENAVRIQVYSAIITYCLVAIVEHNLNMKTPASSEIFCFFAHNQWFRQFCGFAVTRCTTGKKQKISELHSQNN